jgi:hypothetical protein
MWRKVPLKLTRLSGSSKELVNGDGSRCGMTNQSIL